MTHGWVYVLPRAAIVLIGWGATYFFLTALSTHLAPTVIYITGATWVLAGVLGFGYLYKLRRDKELMPLRRPGDVAAKTPAPKPPAPQPSVAARLRALPPRRRNAA